MRSLAKSVHWTCTPIVAASLLGACDRECINCAEVEGYADGDIPSEDTLDAGVEDASDGSATAPRDASQDAANGASDAPDAADDSDGPGRDDDAGGAADAGTPTPPVHPSDLLDLTRWKLTVPADTEHSGSPDEYKNPELQALSVAPYFALTPAKDSVIFQAHAGGATTINSSYPRSELREMAGDGTVNAAWSTTSGVHKMKVRQAITHLTAVKPHVVSAQIHDAHDDVVMVRLEERHLFVESNGTRLATLDSDYELGTIFTVELVATGGKIDVLYNGTAMATLQRSAVGCYFKAGCYTQSNVDRGEAPEDYAQVVIYELVLSHE